MTYVKRTKRATIVVGWRWSKFSIGIDVAQQFILIDVFFMYVGIEW